MSRIDATSDTYCILIISAGCREPVDVSCRPGVGQQFEEAFRSLCAGQIVEQTYGWRRPSTRLTVLG